MSPLKEPSEQVKPFLQDEMINFVPLNTRDVIEILDVLALPLLIEDTQSRSMGDGRHLSSFNSEFLNPLILIEVIDDQISKDFIEIIHASVNQHVTSENPCYMIPSAEALQFILFSLLPKTGVNVKGEEFL